MLTTLRTFDADGKMITEVKKTFNHKRCSQRGAAQQKALNGLYTNEAVTGEIIRFEGDDPIPFKFVNGRSSCTMKF